MSEKVEYPKPGSLYKHYKGGIYEFLFMSPHTETKEVLVIYKSVLFGSYYARALESWNGLTENGEKRFSIM